MANPLPYFVLSFLWPFYFGNDIALFVASWPSDTDHLRVGIGPKRPEAYESAVYYTCIQGEAMHLKGYLHLVSPGTSKGHRECRNLNLEFMISNPEPYTFC